MSTPEVLSNRLHRERMVHEQIEGRGIKHSAVLAAMRRVPRHLFVPESIRQDAYADRALSIGHEQTISQPYIVALMSELLDVHAGDRVLEIGTGSGYQAAVLSELACKVYTIEIQPALYCTAVEVLAHLNYRNVTTRHGDGRRGWPEKSPFDRIILSAATSEVPKALFDQLVMNGKLVAPEGSAGRQRIVVTEKLQNGLRRTPNIPVRFVPLVCAPHLP